MEMKAIFTFALSQETWNYLFPRLNERVLFYGNPISVYVLYFHQIACKIACNYFRTLELFLWRGEARKVINVLLLKIRKKYIFDYYLFLTAEYALLFC